MLTVTGSAPRPGIVLPIAGVRDPVGPAMAAISFRHSSPLVTTAQPSLTDCQPRLELSDQDHRDPGDIDRSAQERQISRIPAPT